MSETIYEQYVAAMVALGLQPVCIEQMWEEVRGAFFVGDSQSIYDCPDIDYVRMLLSEQQKPFDATAEWPEYDHLTTATRKPEYD